MVAGVGWLRCRVDRRLHPQIQKRPKVEPIRSPALFEMDFAGRATSPVSRDKLRNIAPTLRQDDS